MHPLGALTPRTRTNDNLSLIHALRKLAQDFIDGMSTVPNDIRRNSQLMQMLDKDAYTLSA